MIARQEPPATQGEAMKRNVIHYTRILLLVSIIALQSQQTLAQSDNNTSQTRQVTIIEELAPVGLAYGQSLIISVVNPLAPAPPNKDGRKYEMLFAVTVFNSEGGEIARSDEVTLKPAEFHAFKFNRDDLTAAGEDATGRLQVHAKVRYRFFSGIASRVPQGEFPAALELVDNNTGQTRAYVNRWVKLGTVVDLIP
jgi:hypothetical protein